MGLKLFSTIFLVLCSLIVNGKENGLSFNYYIRSCPQVEQIVHDAMSTFVKIDPRIPAAILRLVFHDCQVGGCDGSVLLKIDDPNHQAEFDASGNFGIRNRELIDELKVKVDAICPQQVSCADILVLAARDCVAIAGGPNINVPLGRKDTTIPHNRKEADSGLPVNNVDLTTALGVFHREVGITYEETIAIIGGHTLGVTHCNGIIDRLYDNKTIKLPPNEAAYVKYLRKTCPKGGANQFTTKFNLDPTPNIFDNKYYKYVLTGHGLIGLDAEISRDPKSIDYVYKFAVDQQAFFQVFSSAFVKISTLNVTTGNKGTIRKICSVL